LTSNNEKENKKDEYWLIGNPLRRRILEIIAERGSITASELRKELDISFGTLYYHLKLMEKYLERGSNKELRLSPEGWRALSMISEMEVLGKLKLTSLIKIFELESLSKVRIALATLNIICYALIDHYYKLRTSLMISFFKGKQIPIHLSALHVIGNWLVLSLIIVILTMISTKRRLSIGEVIDTCTGVAVSTMPCLLYLWAVIAGGNFSQYVFVLSQVLTCIMMISMLIGVLKIGSEKAAMITLITMYSALLALEAVAIIIL